MQTLNSLEHERIAFVKEMEEYLHKLKEMPVIDAKKQSKINLLNSKIIQEDGEFTSQYSFNNQVH